MKLKFLCTAVSFITSSQIFVHQPILTNAPAIHHLKMVEQPGGTDYDYFFKPRLTKGQILANVYSRTIAFSGEGFADLVSRTSGSSVYTVLDNQPTRPTFNCIDLYDGRPQTKGEVQLLMTEGNASYKGKIMANNSASGLLYNERIWGHPPKHLKEGSTWTVDIEQPWELGTAGRQTVRVMSLDRANHTISLKRDGEGDGSYDNDVKTLTLTTNSGQKQKVNVIPGHSHWSGYTIIRDGVIISDELIVTRPVNFTGDSVSFTGYQREYILLNNAPPELL